MPTLTQQARTVPHRGGPASCAPVLPGTLPLKFVETWLFFPVTCATRLIGITHHRLRGHEGCTLNLVMDVDVCLPRTTIAQTDSLSLNLVPAPARQIHDR